MFTILPTSISVVDLVLVSYGISSNFSLVWSLDFMNLYIQASERFIIMEFPPDSQEPSDLSLDQLTLPPIRTSTNTPQEQSSPDPLPSSPRAESGSDSLRLSPTPDHFSTHNSVAGNQNHTMAVRQISDTTLPSFSQVSTRWW